MTPFRESLSESYRELADDYLLELYESRTLTPLALEVADEELTRRGIPHLPVSAEEQDEDMAEPVDEDPVILVTVARSLVASELEILRARLEADGIPAFVVDGSMNQVFSLISAALGGGRLQVPQGYATEARKIIAAVNAGVLEADDGGTQ